MVYGVKMKQENQMMLEILLVIKSHIFGNLH